MCGFAPSGEQFFWCYFGNFLIAIACTGYGYFISALAPNVKARVTHIQNVQWVSECWSRFLKNLRKS